MTSTAIGLIETIGLVAAIEAADAAAKAANVTLLGYENTKGGGMITIKIVGDVGAVKAAVAAGTAAAFKVGQVKSCHVIPRPHHEIEALLQQVDRGRAKAEAKPAAQPAAPTSARVEETKPAAEKPKPKSKPKRQSSAKKAAELPKTEAPVTPEAPPPAEPAEAAEPKAADES